jgi:hypothetical protein
MDHHEGPADPLMIEERPQAPPEDRLAVEGLVLLRGSAGARPPAGSDDEGGG